MKNLNKNIYALFTQKKMNNFSICELKNAYVAEFKDPKTEDEARKLIYREVYKLVGHGYLIKKGKSNTRNIRYYPTQLFKDKFLVDNFKVTQISLNEVDLKLVLKGKLIEYKELLVVSTAEMEEYQQCANQYPHLIKSLKPKLELAKNKISQFIGKVTAIENILNSQ